jgi:hypothetical protein
MTGPKPIVLAILAALAAGPVASDESKRVWPSATSYTDPAVIELHAPTQPDAAATVTFWNQMVHHANEEFSLTFDGITVDIFFGFNVTKNGAERVTVIPPDGYLAIPSEIDVPEHQVGHIQIVKYRGG